MSLMIRYPTSIDPRFDIILFRIVISCGNLDASIPVATKWQVKIEEARSTQIFLCHPLTIYAIIPHKHNVFHVVVIIGLAFINIIKDDSHKHPSYQDTPCQSKLFGICCLRLFIIVVVNVTITL